MHIKSVFLFLILIQLSSFLIIGSSLSHSKETAIPLIYKSPALNSLEPEAISNLLNSLHEDKDILKKINIIEPLSNTILPSDIASIIFTWDDFANISLWHLKISHNDEILVHAFLDNPWWIPKKGLWDNLKAKAKTNKLKITIIGIGGWDGRQVLSKGVTSFSFSQCPLNAKIQFMRKPLPFLEAKKHPEKTELLTGNPTLYSKPELRMSNVATCANCHTYSSNGKIMAMDIDYKGDKGAFAMIDIQQSKSIGVDNIFSWNKVPVQKPAKYSMGLFAQLSPKGRYIAGTVNETSVFVMMDDLYFSQLFYPSTGQIAIFDQKLKKYSPLTGADNLKIVQTGPTWSPDGKTIAFSATPTDPELIEKAITKKVLKESCKQNIKELNQKYNVQFDIYTVPFNKGKGGTPVLLKGAGQNGKSNYFPRYSPDGKWIVFTQSPTGLVLQPDSKLCIVPAKGGSSRYLKSNMPIMNSWHSWSPNSKWLVFTCKATSPYTELYLTHINEKGIASPAFRLFRLSHNTLAAMVPEFIPLSTEIPNTISFNLPDLKAKNEMAIDGR